MSEKTDCGEWTALEAAGAFALWIIHASDGVYSAVGKANELPPTNQDALAEKRFGQPCDRTCPEK
jgi:hypothetical protein